MAETVYIVGAGPAGAAAAYTASRLGLKAVVFEANPRLAVKPCGQGIPTLEGLEVPIPRESVLRVVRRAVLYVDGEKAVEVSGGFEGYVVDKELFLRSIIESSGAELLLSSHFRPCCGGGVVRAGGQVVEVRSGLLAGGVAFYGGEKIYAVQAVAESPELDSLDELMFDFDTSIVGYYWVFPLASGAEVGVGGFAPVDELVARLRRFAESRLEGARVGPPRGAPIAVGGLDLGAVGGLVKVGEAAGFVMPLTGEGIRPSMISGSEAVKALASGEDPVRRLAGLRISRAIAVQRRILQAVKSMSPRERGSLLKSIPAAAHAEIALGTMRVDRILASMASRPDLALRLLRYVVGS